MAADRRADPPGRRAGPARRACAAPVADAVLLRGQGHRQPPLQAGDPAADLPAAGHRGGPADQPRIGRGQCAVGDRAAGLRAARRPGAGSPAPPRGHRVRGGVRVRHRGGRGEQHRPRSSRHRLRGIHVRTAVRGRGREGRHPLRPPHDALLLLTSGHPGGLRTAGRPLARLHLGASRGQPGGRRPGHGAEPGRRARARRDPAARPRLDQRLQRARAARRHDTGRPGLPDRRRGAHPQPGRMGRASTPVSTTPTTWRGSSPSSGAGTAPSGCSTPM